MKLKLVHGKNWEDDASLDFTLKTSDGKTEGFSIGCLSECPEDASLERDLNFVYDIANYMKLAYEAGKRGESFEIEELDEEEEE